MNTVVHAANAALTTHDTTRIDDTRIDAVRPLISPALLMERLPVSDATLALVDRRGASGRTRA